MEIIEVFSTIFIIIIFLNTILFCLLSIYIYIKNCTIKLFLIWILSFSILVLFSYLIDSNPIQLYFSLGQISLIASIFFILRIEERSFNYKYFLGFIISIILFFSSEYLLNPINYSFLQDLTGTLYFVFVFTFPKIFIYNKFIKNKSIKYPSILFSMIICLILLEFISGRLYKFFEVLSYYFILIVLLSIIFFHIQIRTWIRHVLNEHYGKNRFESQYIKKFITIINNKLYLLFKWDDFTKEESEKLRDFLMYKFHFSWIEFAAIYKSDDKNRIKIDDINTNENLATIIMDDNNKNIYLKINDDRIYNLNLNVREENGRFSIYKNSIKVKPIIPIEPSDYYLCNIIDDAILNDRDIKVEKINLQSLRFMLVCANLRKEDILDKLSSSKTILFAAFALAIPPYIEFILPFSEAMVRLQLKIPEIFLPNFEDFIKIFINNIFQFNKFFAMIFVVIVIFIVFYLEELFLWFKLMMEKYEIVDLIYRIIVGIITIGLLIELFMLMEIKWSNVLLFIFSLILIPNSA